MGFNDNKNKGEPQSHFAAAGPKKRVPAFTVTSRVPPPGTSSFHAQGLALFCFLFVIDPPCFFSGFRRVHDVYSEDDRLSKCLILFLPRSLTHPSFVWSRLPLSPPLCLLLSKSSPTKVCGRASRCTRQSLRDGCGKNFRRRTSAIGIQRRSPLLVATSGAEKEAARGRGKM